MPCIFCTAVFLALTSQITAAVVDRLSEKLQGAAVGPVRRVVDTDSVVKFECDVPAAGKPVPVAVTVFKEAKRARIQVMTHDITREDAEKLENLLADVLDLRIVERSDAHSEEKVREAFDHHHAEPATTAPPEAARRRWPFGRR